MDELMLFTDGSVNTQSKIGYGAYLAVLGRNLSLEALRKNIKVKRFEHTSSTKLELQTLLWALNDIQALDCNVIVHTDSQNIIGLPGRREKLEKREYCSKNNKLLNYYELYEGFYRMSDQIDFELVKLRGHQEASKKMKLIGFVFL